VFSMERDRCNMKIAIHVLDYCISPFSVTTTKFWDWVVL
jgi:hypothetical protein